MRMAYDEAKLSDPSAFYEELTELPQWTGDGPLIPDISSADVLEKLDLNAAKLSIVISGSSVSDVTVKSEGALYCHIEIPTGMDIPDTLPGGKFMWMVQSKWKDQAETGGKVDFTVGYSSLSDKLKEEYQRGEMLQFCYETAGGSHLNDIELSGDVFGNTSIIAELYSKGILEACVEELKKVSDSGQPVLRQYELVGLTKVEASDSVRDPRVRPKEASEYTFSGTDLDKLPDTWEILKESR